MAYWGAALRLLNNPHAPPPAPNLPLGLAAIQKAKAVGAKTQRERDYIDALAVMYADYDKTRPPQPRSGLSQGDGRRWRSAMPKTTRRRSSTRITLNVAASPSDKTYANQLKGAAILEPIFQAPAAASGRRHYLIHLYDYPRARREGARRGQALRHYRAGGAACAAHAVAHLHPRRLLEGVDRLQPRVGARRKGDKGRQRSAARHGLLVYAYLQLGQDAKAHGGHRRDGRQSPASVRTFIARPCARGVARHATASSAATGTARRSSQVRPSQIRARHGDDPFRARARGGALGQAGGRQSRHRQARRAARQAARGQRRLLVASKSTSSGRSRTPGCSMPKANTTKRSRP